jgi:hypothetical protein
MGLVAGNENVAADKSRGDAEAAQCFHHKESKVAAGA